MQGVKTQTNSNVNKQITKNVEILSSLAEVFYSGLNTLGQKGKEGMISLYETFQGSPLEKYGENHVQSIIEGDMSKDNIIGLGILIGTLDSTLFDATTRTLNPSISSEIVIDNNETSDDIKITSNDDNHRSNLEAILAEIALNGFVNLDQSDLKTIEAALLEISDVHDLDRFNATLRLFVQEVSEGHASIENSLKLRWLLLWSRCVLLSTGMVELKGKREITGQMIMLGGEILGRDDFGGLQFYGILNNKKKENELVTVQFTSYFLPKLNAKSLYALIEKNHALAEKFIDAVSKNKGLQVKGKLQGSMFIPEEAELLEDKNKSWEFKDLHFDRGPVINQSLTYGSIPYIIKEEDENLENLGITPDIENYPSFGFIYWDYDSFRFRQVSYLSSRNVIKLKRMVRRNKVRGDNIIPTLVDRGDKLLREKS